MVVLQRWLDGYIVRTAEREDRNAILKISVYNGLDYLSQQYNHYMDKPNYYCFLGELNGQVVSSFFKAKVTLLDNLVPGILSRAIAPGKLGRDINQYKLDPAILGYH